MCIENSVAVAGCYIDYSGTPLLRPPLRKENLAFIEGCPYLWGQFELRKILWDITMWPLCPYIRGGC